jgi:hypothetical protein
MLAGSLHAAGPLAGGTPATQRTVKLITATVEGTATYIWVTPAEGGPPVKLLLAGDTQKKYGMLLDHLDELLDVTVKPGGQATDMVTSLSAFKGPAGLKSPSAYLFDGLTERKVGTLSQEVVKLSRFGPTKEAVIQNRPGPGGKPAPDPVLIDRIKGLKNGDCVEVELAPGVGRDAFRLLDIDVYREPVYGEFVKADNVKVGTRPTPAIVLNVADEEKTFLVPSRLPLTPAEQGIVTLARKLQPGNGLLFTSREEGDQSTLVSLRVDGTMRIAHRGMVEYQFDSTFTMVEFYKTGTGTSVYFNPRRLGRPVDTTIEFGLRKVLWNSPNGGFLNLKPADVKKLKNLVNDNPQYRLPEDVRVRESARWSNAYAAWQNARDDATRARIEQEMALAAQDLAKPWQEEADTRLALLKSYLNDQQLAEIRKLGKRPKVPLDASVGQDGKRTSQPSSN